MPDISSQAERRGEGKNVIFEEENPLPGRKLPPRSTIKKRPTPQTPCPDQTRGPEPSPGGQGWVDPKNPMGKPANHPEPRDIPEGNTPVHPPPPTHVPSLPAMIPWHPLRVGVKGWEIVGKVSAAPGGSRTESPRI